MHQPNGSLSGSEAPWMAAHVAVWAALRERIETHRGYKATFREASADAKKSGLVFSIDVFFAAEPQTCSLPPKPFVQRQKKRHNLERQPLAPTADVTESLLTARVLLSVSPGEGLRTGHAAAVSPTAVGDTEYHVVGEGVSEAGCRGRGGAGVLTAVGSVVTRSGCERASLALESSPPALRRKLRIGQALGFAGDGGWGGMHSDYCGHYSICGSGAEGGWEGGKSRARWSDESYLVPDGEGVDEEGGGGGDGDVKIGNPIMSKAKFERAIQFALEGDDLYR